MKTHILRPLAALALTLSLLPVSALAAGLESVRQPVDFADVPDN